MCQQIFQHFFEQNPKGFEDDFQAGLGHTPTPEPRPRIRKRRGFPIDFVLAAWFVVSAKEGS
jgi:hypothetical protein